MDLKYRGGGAPNIFNSSKGWVGSGFFTFLSPLRPIHDVAWSLSEPFTMITSGLVDALCHKQVIQEFCMYYVIIYNVMIL